METTFATVHHQPILIETLPLEAPRAIFQLSNAPKFWPRPTKQPVTKIRG